MKPGCQEKLVHRVRKGDNVSPTVQEDWRVVISFRKLSPENSIIDPEISFDKSSDTTIPKSQSTSPPKITIVAGDSFIVGLDAERLGRRGRRTVVNLSKGGSSIDEVALQLDSYFLSKWDKSSIIDKVIVCVGANDIRHCREKGVRHLKGPLVSLVEQIKMCFPDASVWFQSIVPLPLQHQYTVRNVEQFNKLLFEVCTYTRIYFLNVFSKFLVFDHSRCCYFRNDLYFVDNRNIHLNKLGLSVLARSYIQLIHSNKFNPLGY